MEIESVNTKANAGVTLGTIGTALSALASFGGLMGLGGNAANAASNYVTKTELSMAQELAKKDSELALLQSEQNTEVKIADVFERVMTRVNSDRNEQLQWNASQSVNNATMAASIAANTASIAALQSTCQSITKTVVPNTSICPGWGNVTITPATTTTA